MIETSSVIDVTSTPEINILCKVMAGFSAVIVFYSIQYNRIKDSDIIIYHLENVKCKKVSAIIIFNLF